MQPSILTSLPKYDAIQESKTNYTRENNVNVATLPDEGKIAICHLIEMNRHSLIVPGPTRLTFPTDFPLEALAAVSLAMQHLNTGDGSVVSEVDGLNLRCNVRFTAEFVDTAGLQSQAIDSVVQIIQRDEDNMQNQESDDDGPPPPCAFIGAFRSPVTIATALYTSLKNYPQFSTLSGAPELDNKAIYPLFGRLIPSGYGIPMLQFMTEVLHLKHIAVVHTDNAAGIGNLNSLREAATEYFPEVVIEGVGFPDSTTSFESTVSALKNTQFRFIYAAISTQQYEPLILEAYKQGIAGTDNGEYNWIVTNRAIAVSYLLGKEFESNDALLKASQGLLVFDSSYATLQKGMGNKFDDYIQSWKKLADSEDDLAYLQSKVPQFPEDRAYNPIFTNETFGFGRFTSATAAIYDATIALGLGACKASSQTIENGGEATTTTTNYFDGPQHYQAVLNTTFVGASGTVQFDPTTGSRKSQSNPYTFTNIVVEPVIVEGDTSSQNDNVTTREIVTHYYNNQTWIQTNPITFNDGTTNIPLDLPPQNVDYNYIGTGLRAAGLTMCVVILLLSIGFATWTRLYSHLTIVKASQPIFLYIICLGTILMGAAIIPLSLDDEHTSEDGLDVACASIPWLLSLGWCFAFSALFSKTQRVNKIFHNPTIKRVKVEAKDVIKPMIVLLTLNIIILSIWTAVSPLVWERTITDRDIFTRTRESQGECTSDNFIAFAIPLIIIDLGALVIALHQAYVARKISMEFAESEWIARSMSFVMIVSFVGIPILVIANDSDTQASYFVLCALIFVVCASLLCFIFLPKILMKRDKNSFKAAIRKSGEKSKNKNRKPGRSSMKSNGTTSAATAAASGFNNNTTTAFAGTTTSYSDGPRILMHPKLQQELQNENKVLKEENERLIKANTELKQRVEGLNEKEYDVDEDIEDDVKAIEDDYVENV